MDRKVFSPPELLPSLQAAAYEAGKLIMGFYRSNQAVERKADASPVTETDRAADRLIVAALSTIAAWPVVSEEGAQPDVAGAEYFWLVDPLDGTKSFVRGSGYFTVNIALIGPERTPVMGVIYEPAGEMMYTGSSKGAFRGKAVAADERIHARCASLDIGLTAVVSHSHLDHATLDYITRHHVTERLPCASSIKFCRLAEGKADIYPRFGPTSEWDTAAGHAILLAAGGSMATPEGKPFIYGKPGFLNGNFIARGAV